MDTHFYSALCKRIGITNLKQEGKTCSESIRNCWGGGGFEPSVKRYVEVELKYINALIYDRNKKTKPITLVKSEYTDVNKHAQIIFF